ncbi:hypothetical protein CPHO_01685 [Corynebacterium phocae]|uniref:Long Rib domain-containing protein n=1 Tax=Corynebacterium phocae TaxID=161895 RepID=A0A1L7D0Z8_9CORY|nr:Rib/alpha-like domain-containing protein [Corynebacterium phocae]APT91829.1 hypothetical protein CPHO_01685 [Corynebacterium phocae]KAA8727947.1 hypothetical protein F4V58_01240 [Corynebacterium phocae]
MKKIIIALAVCLPAPVVATAATPPPIMDILPLPGPHGYLYEETSLDAATGGTVPAPRYVDPNTGEPRLADGQTVFTRAAGAPGWAFINPDGSITVPARVQPGSYSVNVNFVRADGKTGVATARVNVAEQRKVESIYNVVYLPVDYPQSAKLQVLGPDDRPVDSPGVAKVELAADSALPTGYTATIDDKGTVTLVAPRPRTAATVEVPVTVTFDDGTVRSGRATFRVAAQAETAGVSYSPVELQPGEGATVAPDAASVAPGTKFSAHGAWPEWAFVDKAGTITVDASAPVGEHELFVSYGAGEVATAQITVKAEQSAGSSQGDLGYLGLLAIPAVAGILAAIWHFFPGLGALAGNLFRG